MNSSLSRPLLSLILLTSPLAVAADWPQWRGPERTNVSTETGLLKSWPKDGPPQAWTAAGLGDGITPPAVAGGRVLLTGPRDGNEW